MQWSSSVHFPRRIRRWVPLGTSFLIFLILWRWEGCLTNHQITCLPRLWKVGAQWKDDEAAPRKIIAPDRPTVNLVVASMKKDDISWTSRINIPNLSIIRYYTDDPKAKYHPVKPKGREAMMYFTYFHDFYDKLPDISIMVHADESPWHVEPILNNRLSYTLNRLDLDQVMERQYANLRVSWMNACPDWINTTNKNLFALVEDKFEEPYMFQGFRENFGPQDKSEMKSFKVPEILAQPSGNQFAVTREAVRSIPQSDYLRYMEWLINTPLDDEISGRFWEHSFQYLFTGRAVDCPNELKTYCRMYHVCFSGQEHLNRHVKYDWEKTWLKEELGLWKEIWRPWRARQVRIRLKEINEVLQASLTDANERGKDAWWRFESTWDLYEEL